MTKPAAALPLDELPAEPDALAGALAAWTLARLEDLRTVLPDLAAGCGGGNMPAVPR